MEVSQLTTQSFVQCFKGRKVRLYRIISSIQIVIEVKTQMWKICNRLRLLHNAKYKSCVAKRKVCIADVNKKNVEQYISGLHITLPMFYQIHHNLQI